MSTKVKVKRSTLPVAQNSQAHVRSTAGSRKERSRLSIWTLSQVRNEIIVPILACKVILSVVRTGGEGEGGEGRRVVAKTTIGGRQHEHEGQYLPTHSGTKAPIPEFG